MDEQRNLFLAILLSLLILVGFEYFFSPSLPVEDAVVSQDVSQGTGDGGMTPEAPVRGRRHLRGVGVSVFFILGIYLGIPR